MSRVDEDLRWDDCDKLARSNPIACLLCRTSKLNDAAHDTANRLGIIEKTLASSADELSAAGKSRTRWGIIAAAGGLLGVVCQFALALFRVVHGI